MSTSQHHTSSSTHSSSNSNIIGVHFRVGRKIGEGSFGVIFEGEFLSVVFKRRRGWARGFRSGSVRSVRPKDTRSPVVRLRSTKGRCTVTGDGSAAIRMSEEPRASLLRTGAKNRTKRTDAPCLPAVVKQATTCSTRRRSRSNSWVRCSCCRRQHSEADSGILDRNRERAMRRS